MEGGSMAAPASVSDGCVLSLRIVTLDYYMARPIPDLDACYSSFLGQPIAEVPVVRIFGTTLTGQKMCLHLHKVFPYLYVPYEGDLREDITDALAFVRSLASAVEKALKLASSVGAKRQHVYSCSLVRGKKFYGFHSQEQLFVKIVLYYPQEVARLSGLLLGGGILNKRFQPYEAHIPFLLQVMVDHNLAGMGHVHLSDIKFRPPVLVNQFLQICASRPSLKRVVSSLIKYMASSESPAAENKSLTGSFMELWCRKAEDGEEAPSLLPEKQSTCELEGDTTAEAVLNQHELSYIPLEKAAPEVKMVQSLIPIWDELNATGSINAIGKQRRVPSQGSEQAARHKQDFHRMFERLVEVFDGPPTINCDSEEPSSASVHEDFNISEDDSTSKSNALLLCTQAAHSKSSILRKHHDESESRSLTMDTEENDVKHDVLLNEAIIRHQLTQGSQDTDEEAMELLKWMTSSQQDDVLAGYVSDSEDVHNEPSWSQVFHCADEALAKVMLDYEHCSQQECREIIDCLEGAEASRGERIMPQEMPGAGSNGCTCSTGTLRGSGAAQIPQWDGSCDDEMADPLLTEVNSEGDYNLVVKTVKERARVKKERTGWGPLSARCRAQQSVLNNDLTSGEGIWYAHKDEDDIRSADKDCREESDTSLGLAEHSVRDLMRSKRLRRQQAHSVVTESPAPVFAAADLDKSSMSINGGRLAEGSHDVALLSSLSKRGGKEETALHRSSKDVGKNHLFFEKKPVLPDQPSKFGPLPFVKSGLSDGSFKASIPIEVESETEGRPSTLPEAESETKDDSSTSTRNMDSIQECEMESCAGIMKTDTYMTADGGLSNLSPTKMTEGLFSSSPNHLLVKDCSMKSCSFGPLFFAFRKKPPTTEHLLATFENYSLPSVNNGEVFYGQPDDLPDQPAVMAGMVFKVRSRDMDHLSPYQFTNDYRKGCLTSIYASSDAWPLSVEDSSAVLPSHFHNDGTVLYLLSPVKLPPTLSSVYGWLRLRQLPKNMSEQTEIVCNEVRGVEVMEDESQSSQVFRPSSPKYGETFLIPHSSYGGKSATAVQSNAELSLPGQGASKLVSMCKNGMGSAFMQEPRIKGEVSQISGPTAAENHFTPMSQAGFRDPASTGCGQQISLLSVEAFASTRGDLRPDPRYDSIKCITMVLQDDVNDSQLPASHIIALLWDDQDEQPFRNLNGLIDCEVVVVKDEQSLLQMFVWLIRMYDPDIIVGWEIQGFSLGLLAERAANLGVGLLREISRLPSSRTSPLPAESLLWKDMESKSLSDGRVMEPSIIDDEWGRTHGSGIHVGGRIVLNLWRIMRGELKLGIYTLEAVAEAVLKRKTPSIPWRTLTEWFLSGLGRKRHLCIKYYIERTKLNLQIMNQLDLVNRTSELARVFGIDFFSVLSRGSQYRVESMMLRVAHSQNYLLISPSRQQVAAQPAMQCLPLVMEPESRFYTDPVVVLDFQSLYPSMMIAYNLCFSTCLGKVIPDNPKVLGITSLNLDLRSLKDLKDSLTFTPNGIMFVPSKTRPGVLPRLLEEILSTRIMVKQSMKKLLPSQKILERVLDARQLALKLISNVTYGYTAAGFSGRMPCAELADSIVQSGRFTLERAIDFVNTNLKWNARVVYGDTDSMFVLLKGRSRVEAFKIGEEIAEAITELNPHPVTLKMEKVYHPCVLLTKKRYVGYSYENPKQATPKFDAKGIETVRRDSCGAVAKTLEKASRILFETHNISEVKAYLQRQWAKIMSGRVSLKDFIFAKEVRLGTYSTRASVLPPAAIVASKAMAIDPRAEPRYGERVPYLVVHGEPGARLVDMVVDPYVLIRTGSAFRLHDIYYITKQIIPALQRVFGLIGVDLSAWYNELPRAVRPLSTKRNYPTLPYSRKLSDDGIEMDHEQSKLSSITRTIDYYYLSQHCTVCGDLIQATCSVCERCSANKEIVATSLLGGSSSLERRFKHLLAICGHCGGGNEREMEEGMGCISLACSVFYERIKAQREFRAAVAATNQCGFLRPQ